MSLSICRVRYCRPSPDPDCFIYDPCQPFTMGDNSDSSCQTRFGSVVRWQLTFDHCSLVYRDLFCQLCEMTQDEITRSYTSLGKLSTVLFNVSNDVTRQVTVTYVPPVERYLFASLDSHGWCVVKHTLSGSVFGDTISHIRLNCADSTASSANTTFQGSLVSRPPYKTYVSHLSQPQRMLCDCVSLCSVRVSSIVIA